MFFIDRGGGWQGLATTAFAIHITAGVLEFSVAARFVTLAWWWLFRTRGKSSRHVLAIKSNQVPAFLGKAQAGP